MVDSLMRCGVPAESIGVIALYRQQLKLVSRQLEHAPGVEVLTADRSQGRDKDCIIMSLTRSNKEGNVSLTSASAHVEREEELCGERCSDMTLL
jgi:DNA replication ATP-dependent helicase Dna2